MRKLLRLMVRRNRRAFVSVRSQIPYADSRLCAPAA
jgi:hypothetical protein